MSSEVMQESGYICVAGATRLMCVFFFFQAEDGIRDLTVTGVQTCALPICAHLGQSGGSDRRGSVTDRPGGVEHLLRHSPVWRLADFAAGAAGWGLAGAVERRGIDGGLSDPGRRAGGDPPLGDPVALASCAHEPV